MTSFIQCIFFFQISRHILAGIDLTFLIISIVDGTLKTCTGLQLPGVLDDMFAYSGSLGATFTKETISLNLWAPTAQVLFHISSRDTIQFSNWY